MIGRKKKETSPQRSPQIVRQQQSTFQYSSNRSQSDRNKGRNEHYEDEEIPTKNFVLNILTKTPVLILGFVILVVLAVFISGLSQDPKVVFTDGSKPVRVQYDYENTATILAREGISSRSKILLNRQKISDELQEKFPEIIKVNVSTPMLSRRATIKIQTSEPAVVLNSANYSYLVDNRGVAVLDTKTVKTAFNISKFMRIEDQSDTSINLGKAALTSAQVAFVTEVKLQSEAKNLVINSVNLAGGGGELIVKYEGQPYFVRYNLYEDAKKSFGTFYATKEHLEGIKDIPKEYIDVRIPERAYTK